jgi:hypothetical protein
MTNQKSKSLSPAVSGDETADKKIDDEKYTKQKTVERNKQTGAQNEHDQNGIGPKTKNREEKSQLEGPAAYAPHDESDNSNR